MEKIVWTEKMSVGLEEIDRQHKQLVGILNQLLGMEASRSIRRPSPTR